MNNQHFKFTLTTIFIFSLFLCCIPQVFAQPAHVDVAIGGGNGFRLWDGNDAFKISMGNADEYHYGPVTAHSIKTNMHPVAGRGWTWGSNGLTPVTALNVSGDFQTQGFVKSMSRKFLFGDAQRIEGIGNTTLQYYSNNSDQTGLDFYDKEADLYGAIRGFHNSNSGNTIFGMLDGDGDWSYLATKDRNITFRIDNAQIMQLDSTGNVGIGVTNPQNKLEVCGIGRFTEVIVEEDWCDFVFEPEYCLTTLEEEADFIELYGHLSNFESAKDMNGEINVNDIFKRQQIQLEENVLHLIELNEENNTLQNQVNGLMDEVDQLTGQVDILTANYQVLAKELAAIKKNLR